MQLFTIKDTLPLNFLNLLLEKRWVAPPYVKITNTLTNTVIYDQLAFDASKLKNKVYHFQDVPGYLNPEVYAPSGRLRLHKIPTYKGTLILLNTYDNVEDYLKRNFSSSRRSKFRMYRKRLDTCFQTDYKVYYGEIKKEEYDALFEALLQMITSRFAQKQTANDDLERWDTYVQIGYPLILKKQACLCVIYDGAKPISICLNLIYDKTIYGYIRGYDADYGKFYLGFTDFITQLEWYFEKGFEVFDLLKGEYDYKSNLTDGEYYFEKHVIYDSDSLSATLKAQFKILWLRSFYALYHRLKKWNLHLIYQKIKINKQVQAIIPFRIHTCDISLREVEHLGGDLKDLQTIDLSQDANSYLRKPVYDFLYTHQEAFRDIVVVPVAYEKHTFYIRGKTKAQKITFVYNGTE